MVEWAVKADFISFYSPTQLCGGGTTKSNSNELPISIPLSYFFIFSSLGTITRVSIAEIISSAIEFVETTEASRSWMFPS